MNKLQRELLDIVENGEAYTEDTVNRVLDAVLEALPDPCNAYTTISNQASNSMLSHIKSILLDAKEGK